jgi:hypothetical protein
MIITKEAQDRIVYKYLLSNSVEKTDGFIDGIIATIELINKIKKEQDERL